MIKYEDGYVVDTYNPKRKVRVEEVGKVWIVMNKHFNYQIHIGQGFYSGKLVKTIHEDNYYEFVELLKRIKEHNPSVEFSSLCEKMLERENEFVLQTRLDVSGSFKLMTMFFIGFLLLTYYIVF